MAQVTEPIMLDSTGQDIADSLSTIATGEIGTTVAPMFSTASTYAVNDRVIYNKQLYKCISAVATAGSWDSSKWVAETVAETLEEFNNEYHPVIITADDTTPPSNTNALWVYPES